MTRPGPLALLGGGEHLDGCEPIDHWLLEATGRAAPRVIVPGQLPHAAALEAVAEADLLVLPGGILERLFTALGAAPLREAVLDRWRAGARCRGRRPVRWCCSRGSCGSPRRAPLALTPGLGALHGYVAAPHFDQFVRRWSHGRRYAERLRQRLGGLGAPRAGRVHGPPSGVETRSTLRPRCGHRRRRDRAARAPCPQPNRARHPRAGRPSREPHLHAVQESGG